MKNKYLNPAILLSVLFACSFTYAHGLSIGAGTSFSLGSSTLSLSGNWTNAGTFDGGSGTVVFNGASGTQTITNASGETFYHVTIDKVADDVQLVNNMAINGTLTLTSGDLDLNGQVLTLGSSGTLSESAGNTIKGSSGYITCTSDLNAPTAVNPHGIGIVLTSAANLGTTIITRGHAAQTVEGNSGILRYFTVTPANNSSLDASVVFIYDESELNSITETKLSAFRSEDSGSTWSRINASSLNTGSNQISFSGQTTLSRFTAASSDAPEMDVQGKHLSIANNDIMPSTTDNTDFDSVDVTTGTVEHTFTIKNTGTADLNLTGSTLKAAPGSKGAINTNSPLPPVKVVISGANAADFTVTTQPTSPVASGDSTTFQIQFDPGGTGVRSATVSIANNDAEKNPYTFAIQGTGTEKDSDNDGIPDYLETGDRDGDSIPDSADYDPAGWIYDETNGNIISGGTISVTPSTNVNIIQDGSSGFYQFTVSQNGDYTLAYTPPSGFLLSTGCAVQTGPLDPAQSPPAVNPLVVGLGSKNGATNQMTNWICGDNPYYWTFHLELGDQMVINNNIPLTPQPTGIMLSSFYAEVDQDGILIYWTTETEPNNAGFNIFHSTEESGDYSKVNESLITSQGDATTGAAYSYVDKPDQSGDYYYKLQAVSLDGTTNFHGPVFVGLTSVDIKKYTVPDNYTLSQNYPNPFNPETTIEFGLPKAGFVEISIYDINGKLVSMLLSEQRGAGNHIVKWNASDKNGNRLTSGIYYYKMESGEFQQTNKMILMK